MATALGLGTIALSVWGLGLLGLYHRTVFITLAIFLVAVSWQPFKRDLLPMLREISQKWLRMSTLEVWLCVPVAIALWHGLIVALAPPAEWDTLAYHLALPKLYVQAGRIFQIPWLLHQHWPHLMETLYGAPLAFGMDALAALIHWGTGVLLLLWVVQTGLTVGPRSVGLLAAAILCSQMLFLVYVGNAHADIPMVLFVSLAMKTLWVGLQTNSKERLSIAGLLIGFAVTIKLIAALYLLSMIFVIILKSNSMQKRGARVWRFLGPAALVISPWLARTWLLTGDPVWPLLSSFMPGARPDSELGQAYLAACRAEAFPIHQWFSRYAPAYYVFPFISVVAWNSIKGWRWPSVIRYTVAATLIPSLLFIRHVEFWRFIWPALPIMTIGLAVSGIELWQRYPSIRIAILLMFGFCIWPQRLFTENNLLFGVLELRSLNHPNALPRDLLMKRSLDHYDFFQQVNDHLKKGEKVLLFREIRGYYLNVPYQWGDPVNQNLIEYRHLPSPQALFDRLEELGITHVLTNDRNIEYIFNDKFYDTRTRQLMARVLSDNARPVFSADGLALFQLKPGSLHADTR